MNRIREIREQAGLTQAELARLANTSQPQIDRLEKGERKFTDEWMRRLAKALNVSPTDLITAPTLQEFQEEVEPYIAVADAQLHAMLAGQNLAYMRIKSDALENLGLKKGDVRLFNLSASAVAAVKTGDVVVAQLYDREDALKAVTVVRQYVAPGLLVTNRRLTNIAFTLDHTNFEGVIKGVMTEAHART